MYAEMPYMRYNGKGREQMPALQKKKPKTRLDFRLDAEAKEAIMQAAHVMGKSLSEFAVSSLVRSAQEVLEKHQTITLSNRDFDAFLEAIESDEEPNDALKRAAERYKQRFGGREPSR